jgi:murein DD-endopeptidase MepM/ murein hydrolase activator NlpD
MPKPKAKKKRRFVSFLVLPDDYTEPINFKLSVFSLRMLAVVGIILLIHIIVGGVFYFQYYKVHNENVVLKVEKAKLERENSQVRTIAEKFDELQQISRKLRISLGVDDSEEVDGLLSQTSPLVRQKSEIVNQDFPPIAGEGGVERQVEAALQRVSNSQSLYHLMYENLPTLLPVDGLISHGYDAIDFGEPLSRDQHQGIDITAKRGSIIRASGAGTIVFAGWTPDLGNLIIVYHGSDLFTFYAHNMRLLRKEGTVKKGESIALLGSSGGSSTGPHLHFEIWRESKPVDPREFIFALQRDQSSVEM